MFLLTYISSQNSQNPPITLISQITPICFMGSPSIIAVTRGYSADRCSFQDFAADFCCYKGYSADFCSYGLLIVARVIRLTIMATRRTPVTRVIWVTSVVTRLV
jgi:hypothetical protein